MIKNQNYESAQQSNFIIFICQSSIRIIFKSQLMKEYHGYEYFLRVTPQQINKLSLYNALKKVGQAQLLGTLQLQRVQWQVQCLNKHISLLDQQQKNRKLQKYFNSITTKDIKFEEMIQKNDQIIAQYVQQIQYLEAQINKLIHSLNQKDKMIKQAQSVIILRDQIIHSQKQELKSYQLEIARLKEEIQNRDHRIAEHLANNRQSEARIFLQNQRLELQARTLDQRNQTIRQLNQTIQKQKKALNARQTPIFLKAQFLFGSLIGLIFIACGMAIY